MRIWWRQAAVVIVLTFICANLIVGHYPGEGPYMDVFPNHGLHAGDVVLLLLWASAVLRLWSRARDARQSRALSSFDRSRSLASD